MRETSRKRICALCWIMLMTKVLLLLLLVLGVDAQSIKSEIGKQQLRLTEAFDSRVTLVDRDGEAGPTGGADGGTLNVGVNFQQMPVEEARSTLIEQNKTQQKALKKAQENRRQSD